jgi:hypothetical protein
MKITILISLCLCFAALAGCVATTPNWDERFGDAVAAAKAQQTKNAAAGAQHPAPDGIDGAAAKAAIDSYQKSFAAPVPAASVLSIGVGSAQGASQP